MLKDNLIRTVIAATLIIVVAIFAGGPFSNPREQTPQNHTYASADRQKLPESFWEKTTNDPVAAFTGVLALFTIILACVSVTQIYFLTRADETGRRAADAAKKSADALERSERGILIENIQFQDIAVFAETICNITFEGYAGGEINVTFSLKNYGKTPVTIRNIQADIYLSEQPRIEKFWPHFPYKLKENTIAAGDACTPITLEKKIMVRRDARLKFIQNNIGIWFAGIFLFSDVFGQTTLRQFTWKYDTDARELKPHSGGEQRSGGIV
jgi:hypothetical protein